MFSVIFIILFTLIFDFINGFHDTANAIATSVSTRVLTPRKAIIMSASLNFIGALSGTAVATTIGKGIIDPKVVTSEVIIAGLLSAITWNLITWWWGFPSSSSHALIGGIIGGAVSGHGFFCLNLWGIEKIIISLIISPLLGFIVSFIIIITLYWIFRKTNPRVVGKIFKILQIFSATFMSFSHGSNDAQKSMGIITMSLVSAGILHTFNVPIWVMVICALAMALGTSAGGWRIIKTMGTKIVKLQPIHGFSAEGAASVVITLATCLGLPVSTTHVISGAIMGVGAPTGIKSVRWGIAGDIVLAWIFTIPITALLSTIIYKIICYISTLRLFLIFFNISQ